MRPAIEHIKILSVGGELYASPKLLEPLDVWSFHLHSLNLALKVYITPSIIRKISTFPHFEQLSLRFTSDFADDQPTTSFDALRSSNLTAKLEDIDAYLKTACPAALRSITIHITDTADVAENQLIDILGCLGPALHTLKFFFRRSLPNLSNLFPALSEHTSLRELVLNFKSVQVHMSDAHLRSIENAWPSLRASQCTYRGLRRGRYKCQVRNCSMLPIVVAFARAHPFLERFVVPSLELTSPPSVDSIPLLHHGIEPLSYDFLMSMYFAILFFL